MGSSNLEMIPDYSIASSSLLMFKISAIATLRGVDRVNGWASDSAGYSNLLVNFLNHMRDPTDSM